MIIKNSNKYGVLSEEILRRFEFQVGALLPEQFREFLLQHNGGKPIPSDFKISNDDGSSLHHVYGLHGGPDYSNIAGVHNVFKDRIPNELLAIADDPFGNQICIGIKKKYLGKIYFWDHEKESRFFKFKGTTLLANTFDEFLGNLYEYVDPNESEIERVVRLEDVDAMTRLINDGYDIETTDEYGRTIIENCAIHRKNHLISFLYEKGADLRSSLEFAEKNAEFFEEHKETVRLLQELSERRDLTRL